MIVNLKYAGRRSTELQIQDYFEQFGFEIENFGGREYRISAVPANLYGLSRGRSVSGDAR